MLLLEGVDCNVEGIEEDDDDEEEEEEGEGAMKIEATSQLMLLAVQ